jgi:hypothetical protein
MTRAERNREQLEDMAEHGRFAAAAADFRWRHFLRLYAEGLVSWQIEERMGLTPQTLAHYYRRARVRPHPGSDWAAL